MDLNFLKRLKLVLPWTESLKDNVLRLRLTIDFAFGSQENCGIMFNLSGKKKRYRSHLLSRRDVPLIVGYNLNFDNEDMMQVSLNTAF
jgi:hypothetical protein